MKTHLEYITFFKEKKIGLSLSIYKDTPKNLKELKEAYNILFPEKQTGKTIKMSFKKRTRTKKPEIDVDNLLSMWNNASSVGDVLKVLGLSDKEKPWLSMKVSLLRKEGKNFKHFPKGRKKK